MSKRKSDPISEKYPDPWESGTYQTGSINPPDGNRGLVAVLLVAVILLGGIAGGLGILNIRLVNQLMQTTDPTVPLDLYAPPGSVSPGLTISDENDFPAPTLPQREQMDLPLAQPSADTDPSLSLPEIYNQNRRSLATVRCTTHAQTSVYGIGAILTENGYILTNAQVVLDARRIHVELSDGKTHRASLVGIDPFSDLAVLYIDATGLQPARFAHSQTVQPGDSVSAIQNLDPANGQNASVAGAVHRIIQYKAPSGFAMTLMQTDLGSFSGPLFNEFGQIVGIHSARFSSYGGRTADNGISIPSTTVKAIVEQIISKGCVAGRPDLGLELEEVYTLYQHYWELPDGLRITGLDPNSSAALQGMQEGDILVCLNGERITDRESLYEVLYHLKVGQKVTAVYFRESVQYTLELTVGESKP